MSGQKTSQGHADRSRLACRRRGGRLPAVRRGVVCRAVVGRRGRGKHVSGDVSGLAEGGSGGGPPRASSTDEGGHLEEAVAFLLAQAEEIVFQIFSIARMDGAEETGQVPRTPFGGAAWRLRWQQWARACLKWRFAASDREDLSWTWDIRLTCKAVISFEQKKSDSLVLCQTRASLDFAETVVSLHEAGTGKCYSM